MSVDVHTTADLPGLTRPIVIVDRGGEDPQYLQYLGGAASRPHSGTGEDWYVELIVTGTNPDDIGFLKMPADRFDKHCARTGWMLDLDLLPIEGLRDLTAEFDDAYGQVPVGPNTPIQVVATATRQGRTVGNVVIALKGDLADLEDQVLMHVSDEVDYLPDTVVVVTNSRNDNRRVAVFRPAERASSGSYFSFVDRVT